MATIGKETGPTPSSSYYRCLTMWMPVGSTNLARAYSGFLGRLDMFLWIARWSCMVDRRDNVPEVKHFGWHKYYLRDSHYRDTVVDYSCTLMTGYDDACNMCVLITDTFITH